MKMLLKVLPLVFIAVTATSCCGLFSTGCCHRKCSDRYDNYPSTYEDNSRSYGGGGYEETSGSY